MLNFVFIEHNPQSELHVVPLFCCLPSLFLAFCLLFVFFDANTQFVCLNWIYFLPSVEEPKLALCWRRALLYSVADLITLCHRQKRKPLLT